MMERRNFIRIISAFSSGWVLSRSAMARELLVLTEPECFQPVPLIRLCSDGKIYIYVSKQESGQGVHTSLPMIVMEELEANPEDVIVEAQPFDAEKGNHHTGGSTSVMRQYMPLRKAAATAREMLIAAAAKEWDVPAARCKAERSKVVDPVTGKEKTFAALCVAASKMEVPKEPALKNYKDFRIIGQKGQKKTGIKNIVTGNYQFGIDIKLPGMLYASVVRCPVMKGKMLGWDEKSIQHIEGIVKVIEMKEMGFHNRNGVAIVATNRWSALKAAKTLKVNWDLGKFASASSESYHKELKELLTKAPDLVLNGKGDEAELTAKNNKPGAISAEYELPFLAHATMEPVNCIAQFREGKFELWGGFQAPGWFAGTGAQLFGVKASDVFINLQPMGGGFGRKLTADYGIEAMQIAHQMEGKPVQVLYTREDDMKYGVFRPASVHQLYAETDDKGLPAFWEHRMAVSPVSDFYSPKPDNDALKGEMGGGLNGDMYYFIPELRAAINRAESPVPEGWWRAVNFTYNNFVIESFIDELALSQKLDPLEYRLQLLKLMPASGKLRNAVYQPERLARVLSEASDMIGWKEKRAEGRGVGIACCFYNHAKAYTAHAFDISVSKQKVVTVHKAVCVTDVGVVIDMDGLKNQVEGAFVWGLSEVMKSEITIKKGTPQQSSFRDFEVIRNHEIPPFTVKIIESTEDPGGAGETSVPSVKPALCNAIASASGIRLRQLPLKKSGFSLAVRT